MSLAGSLFLGIVVLWLLYLVPVWLRDRAVRRAEDRLDRRAAGGAEGGAAGGVEGRSARPGGQQPRDRRPGGGGEQATTSRGQAGGRVGGSERASAAAGRPGRPPVRRVALDTGRTAAAGGSSAIRLTPRAEARLRARARRERAAARTRALGALVGTVALVVTVGGAVAGAWSWWGAVGAAGWLSLVLGGGVASSARRRRWRAAQLGQARVATAVLPAARPDRPVYDDEAHEPSARLAEPGRGHSSPALEASGSEAAGAVGQEAAEAMRAAATKPDAGETWTPVEVPVPVYMTKPVATRPPATPWSVPAAVREAVERSAGGLSSSPASRPRAGGEVASDGAPAAGAGVAGGEVAGGGADQRGVVAAEGTGSRASTDGASGSEPTAPADREAEAAETASVAASSGNATGPVAGQGGAGGGMDEEGARSA